MAPEQLEGREADARTDIFAFGAVAYEMATGKRAFTGKSQASLITAIMSSDPPPISTIEPMSPPAPDHVVKTCLFAGPSGPLYKVSSAGGEPTPATTLDESRSETAHRWPYFLPDGHHFLYLALSRQAEGGEVLVGSLDSKETKRLLTTNLNAVYAPRAFCSSCGTKR